MRPKNALVMLIVLLTVMASNIVVKAESGISSYYGIPYHGRKAANGTVYSMYKYTAAHRTLPFGTLVEVENLKNHKKAIFEITDRGPFVKNRILDVSKIGAVTLGMLKSGVAPVNVRILGNKKNSTIKVGPVEESSINQTPVQQEPIKPTIVNESLLNEINKLTIDFDKYNTLEEREED